VITCDEFFAEFGDHLENRVSPEVREELELHLSHCRPCNVLCDSTRKTVKIVTESGSFELSPDWQGSYELLREIVGLHLRASRNYDSGSRRPSDHDLYRPYKRHYLRSLEALERSQLSISSLGL
jgi:hypothetical protein